MTTSAEPRYRFVRRRWHILFAIVDAVGRWCARTLFRVSPAPRPPIEPKQVERLLLVQLDHLGDAVITTSILPALRREFSRAQIDVLAAPWNVEVFDRRPEVHRILVSRWNRFRRGMPWLWPVSILYWAWQLRSRKYDVAIDVRGDFSVAALLAAIGAKRRIGWPCGGGDFFLTDGVDYVAQRHEVESRHALLKTAGAPVRSITGPLFPPSPEAERYVMHLLGDFRKGPSPLLIFHVGAGTKAKTWPAEHWRELIGRAIVELDARVILVGGTADIETARTITNDQFWPGLMDWTGRLSLDQLAALARRAGIFVGADSGPAHVAAAAGAEVFVLFSGAAEPTKWRPWGERVRVLQHRTPCTPCFAKSCPLQDHPCLTQLTPAAVVDALRAKIDPPSIIPMPKFLSGRVPRSGGTS